MVIKEAHGSYCEQFYIDGMDCQLASGCYVMSCILEDYLEFVRISQGDKTNKSIEFESNRKQIKLKSLGFEFNLFIK